ncbi:penicillin acylase family protein [Paraconexibacter antarcticus]|uniref:Penicillin acylase family protein n=1 Tax=Paraconexibacter antarcticus TaxID=2949664 RepID=A0ABY5DX29_9ACTN|nr:penicillin acylase family protein [Paraconexibacter antarcticus]UTI66588.1 penicillin acylase family protein [Paraconexibacter antarcticus]
MSPLRLVIATLTATCLCAAPALAAAPADYAGTARNIIPSGQYGTFPVPAGADEQAKMYDALTPLGANVTDAALQTDFKSALFGTDGQCPCTTEAVPRRGLTIVRDRFDVPHITGTTKDDVTWGAGWVLEEDRGLLLAQGRYPARFAALDAPGINAFKLVTGLKTVTVTKQADAIIDREQTAALRGAGAEGRALLHDIDVYIQGINARLRAEKSTQKPFTRVDVYAVNALAGQIFGQGGGDEARRAMLLSGLQKRLGARKGKQVFDDLSERDDRDTPVTIARRFPYEAVPTRAATGNVALDDTRISAATTRGLRVAAARSERHSSNFLMVSAKRSLTGHPLFVAGPQIGYYYPGLTLEMDLHGPGIDARGAAIPGGPGNILIGRGADFAWSLTSAGSDTNDVFAETLCGGSSTRYRYRGRCRTMGRVDAGTIVGQGKVAFRTTVHGPVLGYAKSHGRKVALSFDRASRGRDVLWELMFSRFSSGRVKDPKSFFAAAATSPFTFNVAYADDRHIATYSAGRLPIRDPRVDPRLPTNGTGPYDWKGFLPAAKHAQALDPADGALVNWNNKPAPGFGPSDSEWGYGSVHRVQLLKAGIARRAKHDLASVTGAMNAAATTDLRAAGTTLDAIDRVLASGPAPSPRDQQVLGLLMAWRAAGSSRLDTDLDGKMDAGGAPAVLDALYPRVADAVLSPVLGSQLGALSDIAGLTNSTRSGFTGGRLAFVDKDLRQLLGDPLRTRYRTRFCGKGVLAACRAALWAAVHAAADEVATAQGTGDPAAWTSDATAERITFAPGLLPTTIRYTNRPSGIQQVMTFTGHRPR